MHAVDVKGETDTDKYAHCIMYNLYACTNVGLKEPRTVLVFYPSLTRPDSCVTNLKQSKGCTSGGVYVSCKVV